MTGKLHPAPSSSTRSSQPPSLPRPSVYDVPTSPAGMASSTLKRKAAPQGRMQPRHRRHHPAAGEQGGSTTSTNPQPMPKSLQRGQDMSERDIGILLDMFKDLFLRLGLLDAESITVATRQVLVALPDDQLFNNAEHMCDHLAYSRDTPRSVVALEQVVRVATAEGCGGKTVESSRRSGSCEASFGSVYINRTCHLERSDSLGSSLVGSQWGSSWG